ncbi:MAG: T9SS type A sorting domain-containing protein [Bacteroidetes bacterium]|nr:T9SS type A sorting domain-containing protein [Bacteroidota bacterium]
MTRIRRKSTDFSKSNTCRAYLKIWRDQFKDQNFSIQIFDVVGHSVYEKDHITNEDVLAIETSNLSSGIYLFRITNSETSIVQRLVVNH